MNPIRTLFLAPDGRLRPGWRFGLSVPVFFVANIGAAVLAYFFAGSYAELLYRSLATLLLLAGFSGMLYLLDRERGSPLAAMGLGRDGPWLRQALLGTALGALMVALAVGAIALVGSVEFRWIGGARPPSVLLGAVTLQALVLAVAAMLEEVAFRGYPFQRLVEALGPLLALVILNSLFSLVHLGNPHSSFWSWGTLNTVAIGVVLGIAYLRTRALWLPWGIHFGWNAMLGLVLGLPVSGTSQFQTVIAGAAQGPHWLTGGSYGIEASITGAVVILIGLAGVLALTPRPTLLQPPPVTPPFVPASKPEPGS